MFIISMNKYNIDIRIKLGLPAKLTLKPLRRMSLHYLIIFITNNQVVLKTHTLNNTLQEWKVCLSLIHVMS